MSRGEFVAIGGVEQARTTNPGQGTRKKSATTSNAMIGVLAISLFVLLILVEPIVGNRQALVLLGLLSTTFSFYVFLRHGGYIVTFPGALSLASAFFVGFAACYIGLHDTYQHEHVLGATQIGFLTHFAMWALFWQSSSSRRSAESPLWVGARATIDGTADLDRHRWPLGVIVYGVLLMVAGAAASLAEFRFGGVANGCAFTGALICSAYILTRSRTFDRGPTLDRMLLALLPLAVYVGFVFEGTGRLMVASLGVAMAAVLSWTCRSYLAKAALVCMSGPALIYFATIRSSGATNDGFGSVYSPLQAFSQLLLFVQENSLQLGRGSTFLATLVAPVPRALWEGKPVGFGSELTYLIVPGYRGGNFSTAGLAQGEWLFNFGTAGLVCMVVVFGVLFKRADRLIDWAMKGLSNRRFAKMLIVALLIGSMLDLYWVGTFTAAARVEVRLLFLAPLLFLLRNRSDEGDHR